MAQTVAVLGASPKPERYSNKAVALLLEKGHTVYPVHPAADEVQGVPCVRTLSAIDEALDTVSVYLSAERSSALADEILAAAPRRLILNPGAENEALQARAAAAGIEVQTACTLVLLKTGQF